MSLVCWNLDEKANKSRLRSLKFNMKLRTDYKWSAVFCSGCWTSTVTLTVIKCKVQEVPLRKEPRKKVLQIIVEIILDVFPEDMKTWCWWRWQELGKDRVTKNWLVQVYSKRMHKDSCKFLVDKFGGIKSGKKTPEVFKYRNNCLLKQNPPQAVIFQVKLGTPLSVTCDWGK